MTVSLAAQSAGAQSSEKQRDQEMRRTLEKIVKVYDLAAAQGADPVDAERALYDGAIRGVLGQLDPFSSFLDAAQFHSLQEQQRGVQKGFGAILNVQSGSVTVLQAVPDSPFGRAGIGPGDRIVRINGHRVASLELQELVEVLQQAKSGTVHLSILQSGKAVPDDFSLSPAELPSPTVDKKFLLTPRVGYLHVAREEDGTPGEINAALEAWKDAGLEGVIMDLRDNPGGSLEPTISIASLFLPKGLPVVSLQGRAVPPQQFLTNAPPLWNHLPLVLLINGRTASAAEIIAAAFQEHDRAWLVGEPSFGKGVVESVMPLSDGAALALTTARYYTPQGRSVQRPVPGTALADILPEKEFHSVSGRTLAQSGGVQPDQTAHSWQLDPWADAVSQSTAFVNFAQAYLDRHGKVTETFEPGDEVVSEFQSFLRGGGIIEPPQPWNSYTPFLKVRIKTEMFNLVFGSSKGDQAEAQGDPQVKTALLAIGQAAELLKKSAGQ